MPNRLRISLVIPVYNEESHLTACLEAALAQRQPFYEIIVVDNGSSDASVQLARQFPTVRVVREPRRGIVHARNRGFNAARGEIIARIDADTELPAEWAAHIQAFYTDPAHAQTAWSGGGSFTDVPWSPLVSASYHLFAFHSNRLLIGFPTLWGTNMALPTALWRTIRGSVCERHGIHEDLDLAIHVHQAGAAVRYDAAMPVPAQLRRVHGSRAELWDYLQWWPQTLRTHGYASWRICWLIGVLPIYLATPLLTMGTVLRRRTAQVLSAFEV